MSAAAVLPQLPPALEQAGCVLVAVGRQLAVLDRGGRELERAPRKQLDWLWSASTLALVERQAQALGLRHELHEHELLVRVWRPGRDAEAASWRTFEEALADLAVIAAGELVEQVAEQIQANDQAARPEVGEKAEAIPPAIIVVEARMIHPARVPRRPAGQPRLRAAERWPAVWRWMRAEVGRVLRARPPGGEGEARGPPG